MPCAGERDSRRTKAATVSQNRKLWNKLKYCTTLFVDIAYDGSRARLLILLCAVVRGRLSFVCLPSDFLREPSEAEVTNHGEEC